MNEENICGIKCVTSLSNKTQGINSRTPLKAPQPTLKMAT